MWHILEPNQRLDMISYLNTHAPNTCAILGNLKAAGVGSNMMMRGGSYFIYQNTLGEIGAVMAVYNDGNIMLHIADDEAKNNLTNLLINMHFHSLWGLSTWLPGRNVLKNRLSMSMDERNLLLMKRRKGVSLTEVKNEIVRIDNKLLLYRYVPFMKRCLYEGFGFKCNSYDLRKRMKERTSREPYWLLYEDNVPIAQAHLQAMTIDYGYIGGICTLRKYRRQGYAKQITSHACSYVEELGRSCVLAVSSENKTAVNLYKSLGFYLVDSLKVYMKERSFKGDENS